MRYALYTALFLTGIFSSADTSAQQPSQLESHMAFMLTNGGADGFYTNWTTENGHLQLVVASVDYLSNVIDETYANVDGVIEGGSSIAPTPLGDWIEDHGFSSGSGTSGGIFAVCAWSGLCIPAPNWD